jgi:hypothetical protein
VFDLETQKIALELVKPCGESAYLAGWQYETAQSKDGAGVVLWMIAADERADVAELIQVGDVMDGTLPETRKPALSHGPRNQSSLPEGRSVLKADYTRFSSVGNLEF